MTFSSQGLVRCIVFSVAILLSSAMLSGCGGSASAKIAVAPTPVIVSHPLQRKVTDYADFTSRTAAVESVEVRARVGGYLEHINFKEGALVKKGDVLFEIDPRPYKAQVDYSISQVAANEALHKKGTADNARNKGLAAKSPGVVTQQDLDQYQAAEDQAFANVGIAKATLETNKLNLDFTRVLAPIDGRISRYNLTVGNLVQADSTLLTTIVSIDPIYAYIDVDELTVLHVRELIREGKATSARDADLHVKLGLANTQDFPREGVINFLDNQVNPKTGTLRIRGTFPNQDQYLTPGLFARVRVPIGEPHESLLVSDRAIDTDQGQKIVYVVDDDNKVISRPVKLGAAHDGLRSIEAGLSVSDRVIVNGLQRVRPGVTVEPKLVDMPGSAPEDRTADSKTEQTSPKP